MMLSETAETRTGEDFVHLGTLKMLLDSQIKVRDSSVNPQPVGLRYFSRY
jgi:hypothetical protein